MAAREGPCPNRIFDDIGGGFGMGCIGGSLWYFIKGIKLYPPISQAFRLFQFSQKRKILWWNSALEKKRPSSRR